MSANRRLSWTAALRDISRDRAPPIVLSFNWTAERQPTGDTIWFGREPVDNTLQGSVAAICGTIVARVFIPGTLEQERIGEFPMTPVGHRRAQAAVEAAVREQSQARVSAA